MIDVPSPPARVFAPDLLAGRRALVTGGGTGLGLVIAEQLADAGADLILSGRKPEPLEAAAEAIRKRTGREVAAIPANIRERETFEALVEAADALGGVDILINNAGGQFPQPARHFSEKGWKAVIDTNLNGTWNVTQTFGNRMLDGAGGVIINIIAVIGRGFPGIAHTAAARAGVLELTRTLAIEWGPKVRLNCVAPGPIQTEGFDGTYDPQISSLFDGMPLPRFGSREEVAHSVVFLASPAASFITGDVIYVAGGGQLAGKNQALLDDQFE